MKSIPVDHHIQTVDIGAAINYQWKQVCNCFQDLFVKRPIVYATSDQKALRLATLLVKEIVPMFDVLEALLSDHGTTRLLCLIRDVYKQLGIKKLRYHCSLSTCNGM